MQPTAAPVEQSGDPLPSRVWRIVHSPRWVRSSTGPDYLHHRGTCIAIVPDAAGGGYRYALDVARSEDVYVTAMAAKVAAVRVLASPRADKARARLLRENQERMQTDGSND